MTVAAGDPHRGSVATCFIVLLFILDYYDNLLIKMQLSALLIYRALLHLNVNRAVVHHQVVST